MTDHPTPSQLAAEAQAVLAKLQELWADEGVDQLAIFLDPGIISVLAEIKSTSLEFAAKIAALSE
ncbi:MAG: hypothetical protein HUU23_10030 [Caldilineales bacterium]|nr:hypothetical protein [Caldilineales bacterium]